jgi:hypothetical protein
MRERRLLGIVALWTLAASSALTGALAFFAPRAFYDDFPAGLSLVAQLPPFNAHLTSDVGGFYLAFALLFAWAALRPSRQLIVPLAAAWVLEAGLHLVWHLLHLDGFSAGDAVAQTAGFLVWLILPVMAVRFRP